MHLYQDMVDSSFYQRSLEDLCPIIYKANTSHQNWTEIDTVINVIVPILTLLGFGQFVLAGTKASFSQPSPTSHRPDFEVRSIARTIAIVETKPYATALAGRHSSTGYVTPLDQILTYLDHYGSVFGILTNGLHWCLLKKLHHSLGDSLAANGDYIGVSFNLTGYFGSIIDHTNLQAFLGMCHTQRLFRRHWPDDQWVDYRSQPVARKAGHSTLLLRDFSGGSVWATS